MDCLKEFNFQISMSHKGAPWENGRAESFIKTLKTEEVSSEAISRHRAGPPLDRALLGRGRQPAAGCTRLLGYLSPYSVRGLNMAIRSRQWRPLRGSFFYEFSSGIGDLSTRCTKRNREGNWVPLPALIGTDESQPVIPGGCSSAAPVSASPARISMLCFEPKAKHFTANGNLSQFPPSQLRVQSTSK